MRSRALGGDAEDLIPLAWFELRRGAGRSGALLALLLFAATLAIGHVDEWRGRSTGERLFGHAYLLGAIALLRYRMAADRQRRFDEYLIVNHVRPATYLAAKVYAIAVLLIVYGILAALLETMFSAGDFAHAAWLAVAFTLAAWLFAPLVMLVEAAVDTSMPAAAVLLAYLVIVLTTYMAAGTLLPLDVLGFTALEPGRWRSLKPLAIRAFIGAPVGFLTVGVLVCLGLPRAGRLARSK